MLQSTYGCKHRFIFHEHSGQNVTFSGLCPGCRSHRSFVEENDYDAQRGIVLGLAEDGAVHVRSTKHLNLKRHKRNRATIRMSRVKK